MLETDRRGRYVAARLAVAALVWLVVLVALTPLPGTAATDRVVRTAQGGSEVRPGPPDPLVQPRPPLPPHCTGNGRDGHRIDVVYLHDEDAQDHPAQALRQIRAIVTEVDRIYFLSAARVGEGRRVRFTTARGPGAACHVRIRNIAGPPGSANGDGNIPAALQGAGVRLFPNHDALVFLEGTGVSGCGDAALDDDSRPGSNNRNNRGGKFAVLWRPCWSVNTAAHELGHLLGAVQADAPHATSGGHCLQGWDVMCYQDGSTSRPLRLPCSYTQHGGVLLDCHNDDYYNPNPGAGTYLATHWNVANSAFLDAVPGIRPAAPSAHVGSGSGQSVLPNVAFSVTADDRAPAGRFAPAGLPAWWVANNANCVISPSSPDAARIACNTSGSGQYAMPVFHDAVDRFDRTAEVVFPETMASPGSALPASLSLTSDAPSSAPGDTRLLTVQLRGQTPGESQPQTALVDVPVTLDVYTNSADGVRYSGQLDGTTGFDGTVTFSVPVAATTTFTAQGLAASWATPPGGVTVTVPSQSPAADAPAVGSATSAPYGVSVAWDPPASDGGSPVTSYTLTAQPGGRTMQVPATTTDATMTGLGPGLQYRLSVTANTASGAGPPATTLNSAPALGVPEPPSPIAVSAGGASSLLVSWDTGELYSTSDDPLGNYARDVELQTLPSTADLHVSGVTSTRIDGLATGHLYRVRLRACTWTCGPWSRWSGPAEPWTSYTGPGGLVATRSPGGHLILRGLARRHSPDLGGDLVSTPVQVTAGTRRFYLGEQADHSLWVRTRSSPWRRATSSGVDCAQPGAAVHGRLLTVACLDTTGGVRTATARLRAGRLPKLAHWQALGATSGYGPAVGWIDGSLTWLVTGIDGHVQWRTQTKAWSELPWSCAGPPAISEETDHRAWFGCVGSSGHATIIRHTPAGWQSPIDLGQPAEGRIAVTDGWEGDVNIFITTPRGELWCRSLRSTWNILGMRVRPGVSLPSA